MRSCGSLLEIAVYTRFLSPGSLPQVTQLIWRRLLSPGSFAQVVEPRLFSPGYLAQGV